MKKYLLSLSVLVMAGAAMAFTQPEVFADKAVAVQYQFEGSSMEDVYNLDLWAPVSGSTPGCSGSEIPCVVTVQSGSLENWLGQRNHAQIIEDATTLKD